MSLGYQDYFVNEIRRVSGHNSSYGTHVGVGEDVLVIRKPPKGLSASKAPTKVGHPKAVMAKIVADVMRAGDNLERVKETQITLDEESADEIPYNSIVVVTEAAILASVEEVNDEYDNYLIKGLEGAAKQVVLDIAAAAESVTILQSERYQRKDEYNITYADMEGPSGVVSGFFSHNRTSVGYHSYYENLLLYLSMIADNTPQYLVVLDGLGCKYTPYDPDEIYSKVIFAGEVLDPSTKSFLEKAGMCEGDYPGWKTTLPGNGVTSVGDIQYCTVQGPSALSAQELWLGAKHSRWDSVIPIVTLDQYNSFCKEIDRLADQYAPDKKKRGRDKNPETIRSRKGTFVLLDLVTEVGCYLSHNYVRDWISAQYMIQKKYVKSDRGFLSSYDFHFNEGAGRSAMVMYVRQRLEGCLTDQYVNVYGPKDTERKAVQIPGIKPKFKVSEKLEDDWFQAYCVLAMTYDQVRVKLGRLLKLPGEVT